MLPAGYPQEEDQAATHLWGEAETGGDYEPYGGGDNASGGQVNHLLSDAMVMWVSACKSATADPWQIEAWFTETKLWLVETIDFPWWPQLLPLTVGQDKVADKNARKLACCLIVSWRWAKQQRGVGSCPPSTVDLPLGSISR